MTRRIAVMIIWAVAPAVLVCAGWSSLSEHAAAQTRKQKRVSKSTTVNPQAPRGSAAKYSAFLHSSQKHRSLGCNDCHKIPTAWTAKREFPDVADFPGHDACVRCHRQQFFTRQSFTANGPAICTVCHVRGAPSEAARFAFGKPNNADQTTKPKDERQFAIEFPHDKHQNVIASLRNIRSPNSFAFFVRASFGRVEDAQKADYNNCSICHATDTAVPAALTDSFAPPTGTFKTMPRAHDACFDCHWKSQTPTGEDCAGCHKSSVAFVRPTRKSAKYSHEGGQGQHLLECTTCHINITRASTLRGLTPDVPITACATCHNDNRKITGSNIVTIQEEIAQFKKTGNCAYCHTSDVGKRNRPASHDAAVK